VIGGIIDEMRAVQGFLEQSVYQGLKARVLSADLVDEGEPL